jgi:chromosome segregation ATPase
VLTPSQRGSASSASGRPAIPAPNLPLEDQLQMERSAREQAEEKVIAMTAELEELSQSLFEEANAMVKTEREKCARLESRLQLMESREEDKRRRLTELEKAISRIARVRNILENKDPNAVSTVV